MMSRIANVTVLLFLPTLHGFHCLYSAIPFRRNQELRQARKGKGELDSIVARIGLKPVGSNGAGVKNKQNKNKGVPVKVQLEYARDGSSVLRNLIDIKTLQQVKADLEGYIVDKELDAWRQKVEVAANSPEQARSCKSIEDCMRELDNLQIGWQNLPFLQFFNTWRDVPSIRGLCDSLGQSASILMDVPSVRLYQDAIFLKRNADGPTPYHTDCRMTPFDTSNMITFWIPLQYIPQDGTALLFVPKSHQDFALPYWNSFDDPEYGRLDKRYQEPRHYMPMNVGDATVHSGWTLHCADGNSDSDRLALAISFVDSRAEIREHAMDFNSGYGDNEDQRSYQDWVTAIEPRTQFGNHPLVPTVWPLEEVETEKLN